MNKDEEMNECKFILSICAELATNSIYLVRIRFNNLLIKIKNIENGGHTRNQSKEHQDVTRTTSFLLINFYTPWTSTLKMCLCICNFECVCDCMCVCVRAYVRTRALIHVRTYIIVIQMCVNRD